MHHNHEWAIVLAAGDGTRLGFLTDDDGRPVPKQFWSLRGGQSLLGDALARAHHVASPARTVVVVAEKHRGLWEPELRDLPRENIIVQPRNCGTAAGLLLPLLTILARDPDARIAVLPSDHHVDDDALLSRWLRLALRALGPVADELVLLGISPSAPETGYGWIVPGPDVRGLARVGTFVEKPPLATARELMARGAVWNSFLMAFGGRALERMYEDRLPGLVHGMRRALASDDPATLEHFYARLESADFSRDLLQGNEAGLRMLRVPECGWTDLGTPDRLVECLSALGRTTRPETAWRGRFSLAAALQRFRLEPVRVAGAGAL